MMGLILKIKTKTLNYGQQPVGSFKHFFFLVDGGVVLPEVAVGTDEEEQGEEVARAEEHKESEE
jgi:hypothetical protein